MTEKQELFSWAKIWLLLANSNSIGSVYFIICCLFCSELSNMMKRQKVPLIFLKIKIVLFSVGKCLGLERIIFPLASGPPITANPTLYYKTLAGITSKEMRDYFS